MLRSRPDTLISRTGLSVNGTKPLKKMVCGTKTCPQLFVTSSSTLFFKETQSEIHFASHAIFPVCGTKKTHHVNFFDPVDIQTVRGADHVGTVIWARPALQQLYQILCPFEVPTRFCFRRFVHANWLCRHHVVCIQNCFEFPLCRLKA